MENVLYLLILSLILFIFDLHYLEGDSPLATSLYLIIGSLLITAALLGEDKPPSSGEKRTSSSTGSLFESTSSTFPLSAVVSDTNIRDRGCQTAPEDGLGEKNARLLQLLSHVRNGTPKFVYSSPDCEVPIKSATISSTSLLVHHQDNVTEAALEFLRFCKEMVDKSEEISTHHVDSMSNVNFDQSLLHRSFKNVSIQCSNTLWINEEMKQRGDNTNNVEDQGENREVITLYPFRISESGDDVCYDSTKKNASTFFQYYLYTQ